jgi:hypothetical protein
MTQALELTKDMGVKYNESNSYGASIAYRNLTRLIASVRRHLIRHLVTGSDAWPIANRWPMRSHRVASFLVFRARSINLLCIHSESTNRDHHHGM